jgi:hypothetical protein
MTTPRRPLEERFWEKVNKNGPIIRPELGPCWLWTGSLNESGYGQIFVQWPERPRGAHRISWEIHFGPIPEGQHVLHHCDNPPCVRDSHLFLGDQGDNNRDALKKGRAFIKIPNSFIPAIRRGEISPKECAARFGVHPRYAYLVKNRKSRKGMQ